MDFTIAALKLTSEQLKQTKQDSPTSFNFCGIVYQRAWLQGVIIFISPPNNNDDDNNYNNKFPRFQLDDGTGIVELIFDKDEFLKQKKWEIGMYVMVVGGYFPSIGEIPVIKVHKIVDLSKHPDREAMWYLEVMEACRMFYQPCFAE